MHNRALAWSVRGLGLPIVAAGAMLLGAWLTVSGSASRIAIVLAIVISVSFLGLRARGSGIVLGLGLLAVLNGMPFVDLNSQNVATTRTQDVLTAALIVGLAFARMVTPAVNYPYRKVISRVSAALFLWWVVTFLRSVSFGGIPAKYAFAFGRDFVYFAVLLPLVADYLAARRELLKPLLATLVAGGALFAFGQVMISTTHVSIDWLVHARILTSTLNSERFYTPMNDLVRVVFLFAVGAALLARSGRWRVVAALLGILSALAIALQLTRAAYLGAAVGLVVGVGIWFVSSGRAAARFRGRLMAATGVLVVLVAALLLTGFRSSGALATVATRATSGFTEIGTDTGNYGYRVDTAHRMLDVLGTKWPIGLGFLDPRFHYEPTLRDGSIRNTDVGIFNVLTTMGAIGAALLYAPLLVVLTAMVRSRREGATGAAWLGLGATMWIVATLVGSASLGELYSVPGLDLVAVLLALVMTNAPVGPTSERKGQERNLA